MKIKKSINTHKDYSDFKKYLVKNGFKNNGPEDDFILFETDNICVYIYENHGRIDISFAHSQDGCYEIKNANFEQIDNIINIFNCSKYISCDEKGIIPIDHLKINLLATLSDYMSSRKKINK